MRYQGGKSKGQVGKQIATVIQSFLDRPEYQHYVYFEPFVGACGVLQHIKPNKNTRRIACDVHPDVMSMWQTLQKGTWTPPETSSKQVFEYWKQQPSPHPMRCFYGFGCSFGAHFFAGYAGPDPRRAHAKDPARIAAHRLLKMKPLLQDVLFMDPQSYDVAKPNQCVIYVDPPYINTRAYSGIPKFDHQQFWQVMDEWAKTNVVIVSELTPPPASLFPGWNEIWSRKLTRATSHPTLGIAVASRKHTTEKLFCKFPPLLAA